MTVRGVASLIVLILAVAGSMLAAPVAANVAHVSALPAILDARHDHAPAAAADFDAAHDSIEHVHDTPASVGSVAMNIFLPARAWTIADLSIMPPGYSDGFDRPPRTRV